MNLNTQAHEQVKFEGEFLPVYASVEVCLQRLGILIANNK